MGFLVQEFSKSGNDELIEKIHSDYHGGDCVILHIKSELVDIGNHIRYLVIDSSDKLVLIYPHDYR